VWAGSSRGAAITIYPQGEDTEEAHIGVLLRHQHLMIVF
jgi:hypothetical protein